MEENDIAKSGVEELVAGHAAGLGIDPMKLVFKWETKPLTDAEHGPELQGKILDLRVYLGEESIVLSFSEELVKSSADNAYAFVVKYNEYVVDALRKLKRPGKGGAENQG